MCTFFIIQSYIKKNRVNQKKERNKYWYVGNYNYNYAAR